jgi:hypothetical protein
VTLCLFVRLSLCVCVVWVWVWIPVGNCCESVVCVRLWVCGTTFSTCGRIFVGSLPPDLSNCLHPCCRCCCYCCGCRCLPRQQVITLQVGHAAAKAVGIADGGAGGGGGGSLSVLPPPKSPSVGGHRQILPPARTVSAVHLTTAPALSSPRWRGQPSPGSPSQQKSFAAGSSGRDQRWSGGGAKGGTASGRGAGGGGSSDDEANKVTAEVDVARRKFAGKVREFEAYRDAVRRRISRQRDLLVAAENGPTGASREGWCW